MRSRLRGDPGNWFELHRALRRIATKVRDVTTVKVPDWAYQLEIEKWVGFLRSNVLPDVLVRLVDEIDGVRLRARGPEAPDPGIWSPLAPRGGTRSSRLLDGASTEAAMLGAFRKYLETASAPRMRDAILALRDLLERSFASTRTIGIGVLAAEGDYLANALGEVLPATARIIVAVAVSVEFEEAVKEMSVRQLPGSTATDWYRRYPGLDRWRPVWETVEAQARREEPEGEVSMVFVPELQHVYVAFRDDRERDKKGQERT
ncbi:MAG: hypothetical protein WB297_03055 [Actinomycetota bacterium]